LYLLHCNSLLDMKIVVKANGGLGNRMRVIASSIALSQRLKTTVEVLWINNVALNCSFFDLFQKLEDIEIVESVYIKSWNKIAHRQRRKKLWNTYQNFDIQLNDEGLKSLSSSQNDLLEHIKDAETVFIDTCQHFYGDLSCLSYLIPADGIADTAKIRLSETGGAYIGVHIRRGDNTMSKANSPTALFIQTLKNEQKRNADIKFYLATDDRGEAKILKKVIGESIVYYPSELARKRPEGIQQALVDLILLSNAKKIIGSYWSSFTEIASVYGNIPLEVMKSEE
jgi:hypothetical protein